MRTIILAAALALGLGFSTTPANADTTATAVGLCAIAAFATGPIAPFAAVGCAVGGVLSAVEAW